MKILSHSIEPRGNELITYQGEVPTYLLPEILHWKSKMEITCNKAYSNVIDDIYALNSASHKIELQRELIKKDKIGVVEYNKLLRSIESHFMLHCVVTITASKPALMEFFDKCCPKYYYQLDDKVFKSKLDYRKELYKIDGGFDFRILDSAYWHSINQNKTTDIYLQELAEEMYDLYNESEAVDLKEGEWHIPYKNKLEGDIPYYVGGKGYDIMADKLLTGNELYCKTSTALISNPTETDYIKLIEIHAQLLKENELDTFVHYARVMSDEEYQTYIKGKALELKGVLPNSELYQFERNSDHKGWCDLFKGFISYKNIIENER